MGTAVLLAPIIFIGLLPASGTVAFRHRTVLGAAFFLSDTQVLRIRVLPPPLSPWHAGCRRIAFAAAFTGYALTRANAEPEQLVACANIASLVLGRLSARHKEIAIRLSMGATREQLACLFPSLRASRIDPLVVLRAE